MAAIKYNRYDTETVIRYLLGTGEFSAERNTALFDHGAVLYREMAQRIREGALTRKALIEMLDRRLAARGFGGFSYNPSEAYREVFGARKR